MSTSPTSSIESEDPISDEERLQRQQHLTETFLQPLAADGTEDTHLLVHARNYASVGSLGSHYLVETVIPEDRVQDMIDDEKGPSSFMIRNDSFISTCTALTEVSEYDLDTGTRFASMMEKVPRAQPFHTIEDGSFGGSLSGGTAGIDGISRFSPKPSRYWNHSHGGGGGIITKSSSTPHMGSNFVSLATHPPKKQPTVLEPTAGDGHHEDNPLLIPNGYAKEQQTTINKVRSRNKVLMAMSSVALIGAMITAVVMVLKREQELGPGEEANGSNIEEMKRQRRLVFTVSLSATIKLLAAVGLGALAASTRPSAAASHMILDRAAVSALSRLVFWIFQPSFFLCRVALTMAATTQHGSPEGISRNSLALMPLVALMQICIGSLVAKFVTFFSHRTNSTMTCEERTFVENSKRDAQVCMTFANSGPLPLLFADALFSGGEGGVEADVTACISFYLLGWSPTFWSYGRYLVGTYGETEKQNDSPPRNTCGRIWDGITDFGEQVKKVFAPPIIGSSLGIIFGAIPLLRDSLLHSDGLLYPLFGALDTLGSAYLPSVILVLAGSLVGGSKKGNDKTAASKPSSETNKSLNIMTLGSILLSRFVLAPVASIIVVYGLTHMNLLPPVGTRTYAIVSFVMLMEGCMPPAQNSILMLQLEGLSARAENMARTVTLMYVLSVIPVTIWLMYMMRISGVMTFR